MKAMVFTSTECKIETGKHETYCCKALSSLFVWGPVVQVVSAALSERKVAGSIPTISDFHTAGPC